MHANITIIMAAYRAADFIGRTLRSIQDQRYQDFTCLIADDCSDDETVNLIWSHIQNDPRFVFLTNPVNLGWIANINQLLDRVTTPYFMLMPHDDELAPAYLQKTVEALETHPEAIAAYSDLLLKYPDKDERLENCEWGEETDPVKWGRTQLSRKENWWIPYRALVRTDRAAHIRLRKHPLGEFEADLPWLLDLGLRGPMVRIPEVLYKKHALSKSLSQSWRPGVGDICSVSSACLQSIWESPVPLTGKISLTAFNFYKTAGIIIRGLSNLRQHDVCLPATWRAH